MRILIVEDEAVAARGLERHLRLILGNRITSLKVQRTYIGSECHIKDNPVDLLFLDLNLSGEDGFELLRDAASGSFQTIIVSGNTDRALEAFEYGVLDFVPKPVTAERLRQALARLDDPGTASGRHARYLSVRREERTVLLPVERVCYIQGQDNYVQIRLRDGSSERHRKTLESLQRILPPRFHRLHRSFLVNLDEIDHLNAPGGGKYEAHLKNGESVPVSRSRYKELKGSV